MPGVPRSVMKVRSEQGLLYFRVREGQLQRDGADKNHKQVSWGSSKELYPCLYYFPLLFFLSFYYSCFTFMFWRSLSSSHPSISSLLHFLFSSLVKCPLGSLTLSPLNKRRDSSLPGWLRCWGKSVGGVALGEGRPSEPRRPHLPVGPSPALTHRASPSRMDLCPRKATRRHQMLRFGAATGLGRPLSHLPGFGVRGLGRFPDS